MTGVIPLPPETNRMRRGRCAAATEVAADTAQTDRHPATRTLVRIRSNQSAVVMSDGQLDLRDPSALASK